VAVLWGLVASAESRTPSSCPTHAQAIGLRTGVRGLAFHGGVPFIATPRSRQTALAAASHLNEALFGVGGALLLLLFSAIQTPGGVAYQVLVGRRSEKTERPLTRLKFVPRSGRTLGWSRH